MNRLLIILVSFLPFWGFSQKVESERLLLKESDFHAQIDLQTKYVWRGMEMMTADASPVVFPQLNYQKGGWYAYIMGGYAINGKYSEVDLGLSYTYQWLTIGINDYYYPTTDSPDDHYFNFNNKDTGHWLEAAVTIAPETVPVFLTVSNFFAGADKNSEGNQAFSSYIEIGSHYDFLHDNSLSLSVGSAMNESCYNGYSHGFGVCNVELKYTYAAHFDNGWVLPLNVAYIINPVCEKIHVNFSLSFSF